MAKEVYGEQTDGLTEKDKYQNTIFFPIGEPNPYGEFFDGQSYLVSVSEKQIPIFNVTFEPGCRNHWHIHHAKSKGGQMLICVGGKGFYQEWGEDASNEWCEAVSEDDYLKCSNYKCIRNTSFPLLTKSCNFPILRKI